MMTLRYVAIFIFILLSFFMIYLLVIYLPEPKIFSPS
jgi:hypothetical protein